MELKEKQNLKKIAIIDTYITSFVDFTGIKLNVIKMLEFRL